MELLLNTLCVLLLRVELLLVISLVIALSLIAILIVVVFLLHRLRKVSIDVYANVHIVSCLMFWHASIVQTVINVASSDIRVVTVQLWLVFFLITWWLWHLVRFALNLLKASSWGTTAWPLLRPLEVP